MRRTREHESNGNRYNFSYFSKLIFEIQRRGGLAKSDVRRFRWVYQKFAIINESTLHSKLKVYKYRRSTRGLLFVDRRCEIFTRMFLVHALKILSNIKLRAPSDPSRSEKNFRYRNTIRLVRYPGSRKRLPLCCNLYTVKKFCTRNKLFVVHKRLQLSFR